MYLDSVRTNPNFVNSSIAEEQNAKAGLRTEQEVVFAAIPSIILPVLQAINNKTKEPITQALEDRKGGCRLDLAFNIDQDNDAKRSLMIMELKSLGSLVEAEFRNGISKIGSGKAEIDAEIQKILRIWDDTRLEDGTKAFTFSKQAAAYARTYKCDYVALCDYETLVPLHFQRDREWAYITFVLRKHFRIVLLGFLMQACEAAGVY